MKAQKVFETIEFRRGGQKDFADKVGVGSKHIQKIVSVLFDGTFGTHNGYKDLEPAEQIAAGENWGTQNNPIHILMGTVYATSTIDVAQVELELSNGHFIDWKSLPGESQHHTRDRSKMIMTEEYFRVYKDYEIGSGMPKWFFVRGTLIYQDAFPVTFSEFPGGHGSLVENAMNHYLKILPKIK